MFKKTVKKSSTRASIAQKIINDLEKIAERKIINLEEIRIAHERAEDLEKAIASDEELSQLDPIHAVYAYAQDKMHYSCSAIDAVTRLSKNYFNICRSR